MLQAKRRWLRCATNIKSAPGFSISSSNSSLVLVMALRFLANFSPPPVTIVRYIACQRKCAASTGQRIPTDVRQLSTQDRNKRTNVHTRRKKNRSRKHGGTGDETMRKQNGIYRLPTSTTPSIHHPCGILGEDCASDASTLTGIHRIAGLRVGLGDALFHRDHLVSLEKISTSPISAWKSMSPVPICRTGNRVAARPCSSSGGKC